MPTDRGNAIAEKLRRNGKDRTPAPLMMKEAETLPDDRRVADLSAEELASALIELKIPGAARSNTRRANSALYSQHVCKIFQSGGDEAVALWRLLGEDNDDEVGEPSEDED